MTPVVRQIVAVTAINLKSMHTRFWMSLSTVVAIALVVMVLLGFLTMANGFERTMKGTGADDMAIVLRSGSQVEVNSVLTREQSVIIETAPGIALGRDSRPLVSPELYVVADAVRKGTGNKANVPLRGLRPEALALRENFSLTQGRMFARGGNEIVVGRGLAELYAGFDLGKPVRFAGNMWTVVGVFDAGGSVLESEAWADIAVVQSLFNRGSSVQSVRVKLERPEDIEALSDYLENDPRLNVEVESENDYFAAQAKATSNLIQYLGWPLGVAMALGALAGALNTMYSSVAARASEIATLRCIGFSGFAAFAGTMAEAVVLALIGAILGVIGTWVAFDGMTASTMGGSFTQVVFSFELSTRQAVQALIVALSVGLIGGTLPAIKAARQPIVAALRG